MAENFPNLLKNYKPTYPGSSKNYKQDKLKKIHEQTHHSKISKENVENSNRKMTPHL